MKQWLRMHPSLAWFCGGTLFMATLGAPLWGAVTSLTWTMQANIVDSFGDDTRASRKIVQSVDEDWGLPRMFRGYSKPRWSRPDTGDTRYCDNQLRAQLGEIDAGGGRPFVRVYGAMVRNEQAMDKLMANEEATAGFIGLPRLALGALAQCVDHSVLAVGCIMWAQHHLDADRRAQGKIRALLLANAREGDDQACFLLDVAKGLRHRTPDYGNVK